MWGGGGRGLARVRAFCKHLDKNEQLNPWGVRAHTPQELKDHSRWPDHLFSQCQQCRSSSFTAHWYLLLSGRSSVRSLWGHQRHCRPERKCRANRRSSLERLEKKISHGSMTRRGRGGIGDSAGIGKIHQKPWQFRKPACADLYNETRPLLWDKVVWSFNNYFNMIWIHREKRKIVQLKKFSRDCVYSVHHTCACPLVFAVRASNICGPYVPGFMINSGPPPADTGFWDIWTVGMLSRTGTLSSEPWRSSRLKQRNAAAIISILCSVPLVMYYMWCIWLVGYVIQGLTFLGYLSNFYSTVSLWLHQVCWHFFFSLLAGVFIFVVHTFLILYIPPVVCGSFDTPFWLPQ